MPHLFFDLDGTLSDPADGMTACIQHAIRALSGPAWSDVALQRFIGPPLRESFREILATSDPARVEAAVQHYRERFSAQGLFENVVYAGIPEALTELHDAGFPLWVVTSKPKIYADRILEHFGLRAHFRDVYGAELSGERSAKSELIAYLLEREHIEAKNAYMIGDRRYDIEGAKAHAGLRSVGVLWGYGTRSELETAGADAVVEAVADLVPTLHRGQIPFHT